MQNKVPGRTRTGSEKAKSGDAKASFFQCVIPMPVGVEPSKQEEKMKKFLVVLLSLGLLLAYSMTASAADVKFSGQYYVVGFYESNRALQNTDNAYSRAAFWTRTRIQTVFQVAEGLSFTTRFDAFEKQWGAVNRSSSTSEDKSNSGKVNSTGATLQENLEMEYGYVTFATKIGTFQIGYQAADEWGTVFADIPGSRPRAMFSTAFGNLTMLAIYEKVYESDTVRFQDTTTTTTAASTYNLTSGSATPSRQSDSDADRYMLAGIYNFTGGNAGLLWRYDSYAQNRSPVAQASTSATLAANPYRQQIHSFSPYFKATIGPVYLEGEFVYMTGKTAKYDNDTADIDKEGYGGYFNAKYSIGPAYVGAQFGYSSGNDTAPTTSGVSPTVSSDPTKDKSGPVSTTSWVPTLFFANHNMTSWVYGSVYGSQVSGGTASYSSNKQNLILYNMYAGYNPTPRWNVEMAVSTMGADKQPTGYQSKNYGTELDLKVTYKIYDNLSYLVGAGYLWTGDYFKGANNAAIGDDYVVLNQLTLNF